MSEFFYVMVFRFDKGRHLVQNIRKNYVKTAVCLNESASKQPKGRNPLGFTRK
jgi:hypothetical protein